MISRWTAAPIIVLHDTIATQIHFSTTVPAEIIAGVIEATAWSAEQVATSFPFVMWTGGRTEK